MARSAIVATYSIVACDLEAGQWGVGVQSKFLAVGSVVPWAEPKVGAVASLVLVSVIAVPSGLVAGAPSMVTAVTGVIRSSIRSRASRTEARPRGRWVGWRKLFSCENIVGSSS